MNITYPDYLNICFFICREYLRVSLCMYVPMYH